MLRWVVPLVVWPLFSALGAPIDPVDSCLELLTGGVLSDKPLPGQLRSVQTTLRQMAALDLAPDDRREIEMLSNSIDLPRPGTQVLFVGAGDFRRFANEVVLRLTGAGGPLEGRFEEGMDGPAATAEETHLWTIVVFVLASLAALGFLVTSPYVGLAALAGISGAGTLLTLSTREAEQTRAAASRAYEVLRFPDDQSFAFVSCPAPGGGHLYLGRVRAEGEGTNFFVVLDRRPRGTPRLFASEGE